MYRLLLIRLILILLSCPRLLLLFPIQALRLILQHTVPFLLEFTFLPAICLLFLYSLLLHRLSLIVPHNRPWLQITTTSSPSSPFPNRSTSLSHSKHNLSSPNSLINSASYAPSSATHLPTCLPYR